MERRTKNFGYLTTKVHGGKPRHKTIGMHFNKNDEAQMIKLAIGILRAIEYGRGVDITIWRKAKKDGTNKITITAPK